MNSKLQPHGKNKLFNPLIFLHHENVKVRMRRWAGHGKGVGREVARREVGWRQGGKEMMGARQRETGVGGTC